MSSESDNASPIALAEQLLELVKSIHSTDNAAKSAVSGGGAPSSTQAVYDAKHRVAETCDALMRSVLGPLEYTVLLAGE